MKANKGSDVKRILIVEDDPDIAAIERDYLMIEGFDVAVAGSWVEAKPLVSTGGVDLILLDIMLPGADGMRILKELRDEMGLDVPVIIVSARETDADKVLGLGLGADDYLVKPFSPSELTARVKAHLVRYSRLTGGRSRAAVTVGNLTVDIVARRALVGGKEAKLTNKEFELLAFFVKNPNHVFSKDELFDKLWGIDSKGDPSTVTVHVKKLREKIGEAGAAHSDGERFIETVWGAGYRFRV